jgi:hypothetical protein
MEEVVAIEIVDSKRRSHFFLTWGRVFDPVSSVLLLKAVRKAVPRFGVANIRKIRICETLQAAAGQPYFFEALLAFAGQPVPYGKAYARWKATRRKRIESGKEIYYLGASQCHNFRFRPKRSGGQ